jgi:aminoglycoside phosphotransferase (APT) family kinase protein
VAATGKIRGLDPAAVSIWLVDNLPDVTAPFDFELIAAGGSNLTFRVVDAEGQVVALRRPPEGTGLATAHDVGREWRIMSALGNASAVAVPSCLARCDNASIIGSAFYVMEFVDGIILRTSGDTHTFDRDAAALATQSLIDTQVSIHQLDLGAVGLADLGRHDGYVERQLKRWKHQVDRADARPTTLIHELHAALAARLPPERARPALAHGDYRFDNVVLGADLSMAAVLDWELCTTGDPIADFAWSAQYWADPGDEISWLPDSPTLAAAFPRRAEVVEHYRAATGFDLSDYPFYEAFSWWKQACIVEGVYARRLAGREGGMRHQGPVSDIAERVDAMLDHARALARALD